MLSLRSTNILAGAAAVDVYALDWHGGLTSLWSYRFLLSSWNFSLVLSCRSTPPSFAIRDHNDVVQPTDFPIGSWQIADWMNTSDFRWRRCWLFVTSHCFVASWVCFTLQSMQCSFTFRCQWSDCPARYDSYGDLESHLLSEHLTVETVHCQWSNCDHSMTLSDNPLFYLKEHVLQHVQFDASCRNTKSFLVRCDLAGLEHVCTYLPSDTVHENTRFQGRVPTSDYSDQLAVNNGIFFFGSRQF